MARHIVFAQNGQDPASYMSPDGSTIPLRYPANDLSFAMENAARVTWTLKVLGVTGNPTTWAMRARFLAGVPSTKGPQGSEPERFPFDALKTTTAIKEGTGLHHPAVEAPDSAGQWAEVASSTNPGEWISRTVEVQEWTHYVDLQLEVNGGTDPRAIVVLIAQTHEA